MADNPDELIATHPKIAIRKDTWETFSLICTIKGVGKAETVVTAIEEYVKRNRSIILKFKTEQERRNHGKGTASRSDTSRHEETLESA